jgi:hypothetical protein
MSISVYNRREIFLGKEEVIISELVKRQCGLFFSVVIDGEWSMVSGQFLNQWMASSPTADEIPR